MSQLIADIKSENVEVVSRKSESTPPLSSSKSMELLVSDNFVSTEDSHRHREILELLQIENESRIQSEMEFKMEKFRADPTYPSKDMLKELAKVLVTPLAE